jgi:amidohydrolase
VIPENLNSLTKHIEAIWPDAVEWRRHLHRHPEVSFKEYETTRWIVEKLGQWGYRVERPCETGCVAVLDGGQPAQEPAVIALRADIDALAISEEGEAKKEFLSQNEGVAHCCGHDLHMSNLLGVARLLSEKREKIRGRVVLIFQAGEETAPGGGKLLMETGLLQELGVESIFGLHSYPNLEPGKLTVREGRLMASPSEFTIEVTGRGGHAAAPHLTVDPIVAASQIVLQLQTIVSRNIDPFEPAVVTVAKMQAGTARNIIPEKVTLEGTIRSFDARQTREIYERIRQVSRHVAEAAGGSARAELLPGYPAVINNPETTARLMRVAGPAAMPMKHPIMAGEDFSFYQQEIPGTFFFLGSGSDEADSRHAWHHPRYNVDERCLKTGMAVMAGLVPGLVPGNTDS